MPSVEVSRSRAHELRSNMTDAERRLWTALRRKQIAGHRFRRQMPLGPYIVDFFCPALRLIIEVDGGQRTDSPVDEQRDLWMESQGFQVVRFWNNDVLQNLEGVIARLAAICQERGRAEAPQPPPPCPPP